MSASESAFAFGHPAVRRWFEQTFGEPTPAQRAAWPALQSGASVLLLAPTGSGKTLAAFLVAIDQLLLTPRPDAGTRVLYISPLKALGVDIERNLTVPLAGIRAVAQQLGLSLGRLELGVRSGDTEPKVRARLQRHPPEILITTPESLYLMLTSKAREALAGVDTVIVDEIHSFGSGKRGAHLFLNLERLERARTSQRPLQRIGLSATQRPLSEVATLLGGFHPGPDDTLVPRAVRTIEVLAQRPLEVSVEVPLDDLTQLGGDGSVWPSIHPRLLDLVRAHRTTMVFVNNRRLAERLAHALNELAGEELVLAHHGSVAKERRALTEERLKSGDLRAVVATSSLELGIDMGSVDLVVQIEAPPTVAAGVQRIGRAGHFVGGVSQGIVFPKYPGDLVAAAAAAKRIALRDVEATRYVRNPLDVLAQVVVAEVVRGPVRCDALYQMVRSAAPFAELPRAAFDGVLDMLSGRYPSERFRDLRARLLWDRQEGVLRPRRGARMLAIANGGTIVDRGLFGVYASGSEPPLKLGELDEEMVFESRVGEVFLLGATSWRIDQISLERVFVSPAPGEPGAMPFWKGRGLGRSFELGRSIGQLLARVSADEPEVARAWLAQEHRLDARAAKNLVDYVARQKQAGVVPTDQRVVVECFLDEVGDTRVVVLSPFGSRVHAPWWMAVRQRLGRELGTTVAGTWSDDGMVFRVPGAAGQPELAWFLPDAASARQAVEAELGQTSLFAAHFRECAARALLLPRRGPNRRTPLWVQSQRAADLLLVARDYPDFPIVLEAYRECLRDVFDLDALSLVLDGLQQGELRAEFVQTRVASPFAAALLLAYVASYLYQSDAPQAERRAQTLALDPSQLRALLGEPELRDMLDARVLAEVEARLQRRAVLAPLETKEDLCDCLWRLGDLSAGELAERGASNPEWLRELRDQGSIVALELAGEQRYVAVEDAALYRDALGVELPAGLPSALLGPVPEACTSLVLRYARTHGPFRALTLAQRYAAGAALAAFTPRVVEALERLVARELLVRGAFLPGGTEEEWCHRDVLSRIKQGSLARARRELSPVPRERYADFLGDWHGLGAPGTGPEALLAAVTKLEGLELPFEDLESAILSARVRDYHRADLDELCLSGELIWLASGSQRDARVRLYRAERFAVLHRPGPPAEGESLERIRRLLRERGALFFSDIATHIGGFEGDVFSSLWQLVWAGEVTNDTLAPLRSLLGGPATSTRSASRTTGRRLARPGSQGRWSLVPAASNSPVERARAEAESLLVRHGIVSRETLRGENLPGGFAALYPLLSAMEDAGRVRRGYFVEGLGGAQFAYLGAEGRVRQSGAGDAPARALCASDPANPYGAVLQWPAHGVGRFARASGTFVVLRAGRLLAYVKQQRQRWYFPEILSPSDEAALQALLHEWFRRSGERVWWIEAIDDGEPARAPFYSLFSKAGFVVTGKGLQKTHGGA